MAIGGSGSVRRSSVEPVVVVGGGIGGVAAGLALVRTGQNVVVLERSESPVDVGSGITLFSNAMAALDAIGVGDAVRAAGAPPPVGSGGLRTPAGRVLVDAASVPAVRGLYAFHRADLHRTLRGLLPPGVLRVGHHVTGVDARPEGVRVELAGRDPIDASMVVAADGWRSPIRGWMHPGYPGPRYAGYTSWRAVTERPVDLAGVAGETWGTGERFGILGLRDGRVYWFGVANLPPNRTLAAPAEVRRRFGGWHDPIPALLAATDPETLLALDIYDLTVPLPSFTLGRVVLLGDAAHAMTPDLGQGAGQACEDAVVLAAALADGPTVVDALRRYDRQRRPRTQELVQLARRTGRLAQAEARLAVPARTLLLRLTPPSVSLRMVERVTTWTPPASGGAGLSGSTQSESDPVGLPGRRTPLGGRVTVTIPATADQVWSRVSDVTRIGEFSPETFEAEWLDGLSAPRVGGRFRGHVYRNGRGPTYWSTCTVTECEPGRVFAFTVGVGATDLNTWRYTIEPDPGGGVRVTESFALPPRWFNRVYWAVLGRARGRTNLRGMDATLRRIKADIEAHSPPG